MYNFAPKNSEAYESKQIQGVAYLKKSGLDKQGKAPIMGRITLNNSMAQFSCKLVLNPNSGIKAKGAGSHKVWGGR